MLEDTDQQNGQAEPTLESRALTYLHPAGFEPSAYLIVGLDKQGRAFINMPTDQPHLCLYLATKGLDYASQAAVMKLQESLLAKSAIIPAPPGMSIPPWAGPAGRG